MLIFHVELIVQSFSTSEHLRTSVKYSSPFWRYEKSRDGCVSAIKEEPRPSSCSQDIDVVKFYEPYRDRFANRQDLLLLGRLASRSISTIWRKLKTIRESGVFFCNTEDQNCKKIIYVDHDCRCRFLKFNWRRHIFLEFYILIRGPISPPEIFRPRKTIEIVFFTSAKAWKLWDVMVFFALTRRNVSMYCEYYNGSTRYGSMMPGEVKWLSLYLPRSRNTMPLRALFFPLLGCCGLLERVRYTADRKFWNSRYSEVTESPFRLTTSRARRAQFIRKMNIL